MTTTHDGPTPYDRTFEQLAKLRLTADEREALLDKAEGYRLAKSEAAPLMEALVLLVNYIGWTSPQKVEEMTRDWLWDSSPRHLEVARQAWDAIAQAQGRTP